MIEGRSARDISKHDYNECKNRMELHYRNKYITLVKHSQHKQDAFQELNGCNYYVILLQGTILFMNFFIINKE